jgi:hypothetical protein
MSARPRTKATTWYKEHYEKIALVIVLTALLGSSLLLLLQINEARRALSEAANWQVVDMQARPYQAKDSDQYAPYLAALENPFQIPARTNLLMVSELRIASVNPDVVTPIPYNATVCPWTQYPQPSIDAMDSSGDGIPDVWLAQYGLDPFDRAIGLSDPDSDGFTVREEFDAKTNPVDPASHPSYGVKLRVNRVVNRPFGLRFMGTSELAEGDIRYQINVLAQDRSYYVKMNEEVDGFTLVKYTPRTRQGNLGTVDASVLTLQRAGKQINLVVNQDYREQERAAELILITDQSTYRVNVGETFTVGRQSFKVIDIQPDHVVIRDDIMGQDVRLEMIAPGDLAPAPGKSDDDLFIFEDETMRAPPVSPGVRAPPGMPGSVR